MRIGVVAPSSRFSEEAAERVLALASAEFPQVEIVFHQQCFRTHTHFAGPDAARAEAFVQFANDPGLDALWFARGGYGSNRFAEDAIAALGPAARDKLYMGYSDAGFLLAGLYRAGFPHLAHGPMPQDAVRDDGEAAVRRALAWLADRAPDSLEPGLERGRRHAAFNLTVFSQLLGTPLEPDLSDHVLLLEDVSEHTYRTDRTMFHVTNNAAVRKVAGMRFGRFTDVPENDPPFGETDEEVTRFWCEKARIPWLGRADIGHDSDNRIVPFGAF
jgi:muramoyltetrapeptide carboxypeptidase